MYDEINLRPPVESRYHIVAATVLAVDIAPDRQRGWAHGILENIVGLFLVSAIAQVRWKTNVLDHLPETHHTAERMSIDGPSR
jgi:hypothetical protein